MEEERGDNTGPVGPTRALCSLIHFWMCVRYSATTRDAVTKLLLVRRQTNAAVLLQEQRSGRRDKGGREKEGGSLNRGTTLAFQLFNSST